MKIGIITMHNVVNYGSALQAYALQHTLEQCGFVCEIIDYRHKQRRKEKVSFIKQNLRLIITFAKNCVTGFANIRSREKFRLFWQTCLNLTKNSYDRESIIQSKFDYDIYMTGSDQVWNPNHIGKDMTYFLSFAPSDAPKISYASSFAITHLDETIKPLYSEYLKKYKHISVRETSGKEIVRQLIGEEATVDIDPVFLINAQEWSILSNKSQLKINERYILVYALYYMFDPYPELRNIIKYVQKTLNCKVIYLNARTSDLFMPHSKVYKAGGPYEFLYLIKNAEIVITTSFHGASFSAIFNKPLLGIVKGDKSDDRISSLLYNLGSEKSIVPYDKDISHWDTNTILSLKCNKEKLEQLIDTSKSNLLNSIRRANNE